MHSHRVYCWPSKLSLILSTRKSSAKLPNSRGRVSLFAKNLDTGKTYALDADERVRTASTIKIAVMVEAFARVAAGKAKWTDELVLTKKKKVSGSGILQELSDGLHITLRDGVNLMIQRRAGSPWLSPAMRFQQLIGQLTIQVTC